MRGAVGQEQLALQVIEGQRMLAWFTRKLNADR